MDEGVLSFIRMDLVHIKDTGTRLETKVSDVEARLSALEQTVGGLVKAAADVEIRVRRTESLAQSREEEAYRRKNRVRAITAWLTVIAGGIGAAVAVLKGYVDLTINVTGG